jgi:membrane associated rhomboid family serine protease
MFFPISDDNPAQRRPVVNFALIGINIVAFLATLALRDPSTVVQWTMVPADLHWPTLFTNLFLHANVIHLLGNLWMLYIFGDNVEDRLGHVGYALFYFAGGLAADAAHIATHPTSDIPTLGASGAISAVMGAYVCFFPHQKVRTLVFLGFFFTFWEIPAFIWMGIWFVEQLLLIRGGLAGGVAYSAHIGGFLAGAAIGVAVRVAADHWPSRRRAELPDARTPERRLFAPIPDDPGIEFMDEPGDVFSVLRLNGEPTDVGRIGEIVAAVTNEAPSAVSSRLETTRGMIARAIPRDAAGRIQRELHTHGIPTAIILHNRSNFPPKPVPVEGASWDDRVLRLRAGEQMLMVPWSAPFLFAGARLDGRAFIDVFLNRRTAYRILDARHVPLTEVDPLSRKEVSMDLAGFARAVLDRGGSGSTNDGVRAAADTTGWGQLDFRSATDYDDYIFWLYNLILAQSPRP